MQPIKKSMGRVITYAPSGRNDLPSGTLCLIGCVIPASKCKKLSHNLYHSPTRSPVAEVADLAVDVVVGPLDAVEVVELRLALAAREALLVVQTALRVHLLRLEHLKQDAI